MIQCFPLIVRYQNTAFSNNAFAVIFHKPVIIYEVGLVLPNGGAGNTSNTLAFMEYNVRNNVGGGVGVSSKFFYSKNLGIEQLIIKLSNTINPFFLTQSFKSGYRCTGFAMTTGNTPAGIMILNYVLQS
jgi:cellulase/cellobiase CelA1